MSEHVVHNVVYLTTDRLQDAGGGITCTCGWHAEAMTHQGVADAFADHRRFVGFLRSDPNRPDGRAYPFQPQGVRA